MMRNKFSQSEKYGRWSVIAPATRSESGLLRWSCRCECGTERVVLQSSLLSGKSPSCGCLSRYAPGQNGRLTHGATVGGYTPEYRSWLHMRSRCYNPNVKKFENHGGRGITVCERWRNSFENFLDDMGPRPSARHSVERRDNDGHYEPNNCYWATPQEQQRNKRTTVLVHFRGEPTCLRAACLAVGVDYKLVHLRISRGWSVQDAVAKPIARNGGASSEQPTSKAFDERALRVSFAAPNTDTYRLLQNRMAAA